MDLYEIEELTAQYSEARGKLAELVGVLHAEIEAAKRRRIAAIKRAVAATADKHAALHAAVDGAHELFGKPRTRTFHGVKVGMQKQRGQVVIDDEERTIARARDLLPEDQVELLVRVRESVHKPAVYDLVASDLKRLGIKIEDDTDAVVIRPTDRDVDKMVDALLKDAERIEEEQAA
jgi:hypothetical protein